MAQVAERKRLYAGKLPMAVDSSMKVREVFCSHCGGRIFYEVQRQGCVTTYQGECLNCSRPFKWTDVFGRK
jgi:DNA-directed RNA polymerase subunit RPC12/RpoP